MKLGAWLAVCYTVTVTECCSPARVQLLLLLDVFVVVRGARLWSTSAQHTETVNVYTYRCVRAYESVHCTYLCISCGMLANEMMLQWTRVSEGENERKRARERATDRGRERE